MTTTNFFATGSPYLSHPLLTDDRTTRELEALTKMIGAITGDVLDVGCGFGRHAIALAERAASVTGADPSADMIAEARTRAIANGRQVEFWQQAIDDIKAVDAFDTVLCLFTSFGQLSSTNDDASNERHLRSLQVLRRTMRPGGQIVVEVPNREVLSAQLITEEQLGPTKVHRDFDHTRSVITEQFHAGDGAVFVLAYRVFTPEELTHLFNAAGFVNVQRQLSGLVEPPMTMMTLTAQQPRAS